MATHGIEKMWENLLKEDTGSRVQIIQEIHELIHVGEIEVAKGMLRTLIKVTCGYPAISDKVGRNSKSIMRMLSPDVDPGVKAFMAVVRAVERQPEKSGPGENPLSRKATLAQRHDREGSKRVTNKSIVPRSLWARSFLTCTNPAVLTHLLTLPDSFNIIYIMRT